MKYKDYPGFTKAYVLAHNTGFGVMEAPYMEHDVVFETDNLEVPGFIPWVKKYGIFKNAWEKCQNHRELLFFACKIALKHNDWDYKKRISYTACQIARSVLKYIPKNNKAPLKAIEAVEGYLAGNESHNTVLYAAGDCNRSVSKYRTISLIDACYSASSSCAAALANYEQNLISSSLDAGYRAISAISCAEKYSEKAEKEAEIQICEIIRKHLKINL